MQPFLLKPAGSDCSLCLLHALPSFRVLIPVTFLQLVKYKRLKHRVDNYSLDFEWIKYNLFSISI